MNPVDRSKISALIDGELPREQAEAVQEEIAANAAFRSEYEELAALDSAWKAEAQAAMFRPSVSFPKGAVESRWPFALVLTTLLALRVVLKVLGLFASVGVAAVFLGVVLACSLQYLISASDRAGKRLALEHANPR